MVDSHHHLWKYNDRDYVWMDEHMEILKRDYLPAELRQKMVAGGVTQTVVVQARQSLAETNWLLDLANKSSFIGGVVGWVDLCRKDIEEVLEKYSPFRKLKGVRHVVHDEPDDEFMARDDFRHGISALKEFGLSYDLLLFPKHLPLACQLAEEFPDQAFVIDHMAKPRIRKQLLEPWKSDISCISQLPNVYCKLSGMITEADWKNWKTEDFYPYLDHLFEQFSHERLMVGSDWPVCRLAGEYEKVMQIVPQYMSNRGFSTQDQEQVFKNTAIHFYRLDK